MKSGRSFISFWLAFLVAGLTCFGVLGTSLDGRGMPGGIAKPGKILDIRGSLEFKKAGEGKWRVAKKGQNLKDRVALRTSTDGMATFTVIAGFTNVLLPSSEIVLHSVGGKSVLLSAGAVVIEFRTWSQSDGMNVMLPKGVVSIHPNNDIRLPSRVLVRADGWVVVESGRASTREDGREGRNLIGGGETLGLGQINSIKTDSETNKWIRSLFEGHSVFSSQNSK